MKKIKCILASLAFMIFAVMMYPRQASASYWDLDGWSNSNIFIFSINAGWDAMIPADGSDNKLYNGFSAKLSVGIHFLLFISALIEQDLGYIDYDYNIDLGSELESLEISKSQKLFKGGTFLTYPIYFGPIDAGDGFFMANVNLGIGAVYMTTPDNADKDIEAWFGFRPGASLFYVIDRYPAIGFGLEFVYTLAVSESNCFNDESVLHFISTQAKLLFKF